MKKIFNKFLKLNLLITAFVISFAVFAVTPVDQNLKTDDEEEISSVFRDMGVVQKRAMAKGGRFLLSTFGTLDFSDGPYTNYSGHFNPGYAFSDFFEAYINFVPVYVVSPRSIVKKVNELTLENGQKASISAARPKYQIGTELLWAPAYGKDSLGTTRVIRSDTFFKLGVSQIKYDVGTGLRTTLGIGKTYFFGKSVGLRFCLDYGYLQTIVDEEKSFRSMLLTEFGFMFYL